MKIPQSTFIIENGEGSFTDMFFVVEYDHVRRVRAILSIHHERDEAEKELTLAKAGQHSTQLQPGGTLGIST